MKSPGGTRPHFRKSVSNASSSASAGDAEPPGPYAPEDSSKEFAGVGTNRTFESFYKNWAIDSFEGWAHGKWNTCWVKRTFCRVGRDSSSWVSVAPERYEDEVFDGTVYIRGWFPNRHMSMHRGLRPSMSTVEQSRDFRVETLIVCSMHL